jgi:hypothetical protein
VSKIENDRWRQALERLIEGQQEALEVLRQAVEGADAPTEDTLLELEDILVGASEDMRSILGIDEEGGS